MDEFEFWADIKGYEGQYEISDLGRVKGVARLDYRGWRIKEKIFKLSVASNGYYTVCLTKANIQKTHFVHQLVAEAFLGHKKCGYNAVINHIDFNPLNNSASNLEITSQRENTNKKHVASFSKYTGVIFDRGKWVAQILDSGKNAQLGRFPDEYSAHIAYETALKEISVRKPTKDSEKLIEKTLKKEVKNMGGWAMKLLCGLISGLPDQLCLLPGGVIFFAELKSSGKEPSPIQRVVHKRLRRLGFQVYIIDNLNDLHLILNTYRS